MNLNIYYTNEMISELLIYSHPATKKSYETLFTFDFSFNNEDLYNSSVFDRFLDCQSENKLPAIRISLINRLKVSGIY